MTNAQILGELYKLLPEVDKTVDRAIELVVYRAGHGRIQTTDERALICWDSLRSALPAVRKYLRERT